MRNLKTIVTRELSAGNINRNSRKQEAMTRIIDDLLKNKIIGEHEYQHATLYGLEHIGLATRMVTTEPANG
jgi:hypothetical protein